jgi:hypothetical protein
MKYTRKDTPMQDRLPQNLIGRKKTNTPVFTGVFFA